MDKKKIKKQHGLWGSPISPISMARGLTFSDVTYGDGGVIGWREMRSDLGVIVLLEPGGQAMRDLNSDFSVRAKVGYGGGDFTLGGGQVYFVEAESGRLYRQSIDDGQVAPITPAFGDYASPRLSPDGRWVLFVHTYEGEDSLGIVDSEGKYWPQKLVMGNDFYMQPVWHPKGELVAWIAWNQPNMPWDGTYLRMGRLRCHKGVPPIVDSVETVAGDESTSIFQPEFSPNGRQIAYVSDVSGWWQLYLFDLETRKHRQVTFEAADHGNPAWVQGLRTHAFSPDSEKLIFIRNHNGFASLWQVDIESGEEERLPLDDKYTWLEQIAVDPESDPVGEAQIALLASGSTIPPRVITYRASRKALPDVDRGVQILRRATAEDLSPQTYAPTQSLTWKGMDGEQVHGLFVPPHNLEFEGSGKPPLIVSIHGGPTSQVRAKFNSKAQFFATRGYAVLEVNYRGSTGYGRDYWRALNGEWGVFDVEDAISGTRYLAEQGLVDGTRAIIMGGSAGGFTVLQALVNQPGFFKAGVCLYGVANQFTLAAETHKFEARYLDMLLGPLPEVADIYRARSPIFHADKIQDPLIVFQGEDDKVVPRAQSDAIVASLQRRGVPHEYHLYPGEGHGFRKIETIEHFYKTVDRFLKQHVIYA